MQNRSLLNNKIEFLEKNYKKEITDIDINCLVSIIIPTHNGSSFLTRAIESAIKQTYPKIEVIVVDDNGEGTEEQKRTQTVIKNFSSNKNLKYYTYEKNINASHARNVGIKNSKGKYIAFLDDDDEMLPDKIKMQIECLQQKDKSYAACYTDYKVSRGSYTEVSKENREGKLYFEALTRNLYVCGGSNLMVRRDAIDEIGGFDETFKRNQDLEFLVRILEKYNIAHVNGYHLIIHLENRGDRKKTYSYEFTNNIANYFLAKFKDKIENLNILEKSLLNKYFALDRFKSGIQTNNLKDALINLKKNKVGIGLLFRYIFYLVKRRITKTIYGFKI